MLGFVVMVLIAFFFICSLRVKVLALYLFTAGMSRLREVKSTFGDAQVRMRQKQAWFQSLDLSLSKEDEQLG